MHSAIKTIQLSIEKRASCFNPAPITQWIECLLTKQEVRGSNPFRRAKVINAALAHLVEQQISNL